MKRRLLTALATASVIASTLALSAPAADAAPTTLYVAAGVKCSGALFLDGVGTREGDGKWTKALYYGSYKKIWQIEYGQHYGVDQWCVNIYGNKWYHLVLGNPVETYPLAIGWAYSPYIGDLHDYCYIHPGDDWC